MPHISFAQIGAVQGMTKVCFIRIYVSFRLYFIFFYSFLHLLIASYIFNKSLTSSYISLHLLTAPYITFFLQIYFVEFLLLQILFKKIKYFLPKKFQNKYVIGFLF